MYCMKCGAELPEDALFCVKCGFKQIKEDGFENDQALKKVNIMEKDVALFQEKEDKAFEHENDKEGKKTFGGEDYIAIKDTLSIKGMLNGNKLEYYINNYLDNGMFRFKIKEHQICYPENITMYINVFYYFRTLDQNINNKICKEYSENVIDMESFIKKGLMIYLDAVDLISESTVQLLVSSGIMRVDKETVRKMLNAPQDRLAIIVGELFNSAYMATDESQSKIDFREMNYLLSNDNSYVAGGFGFSGVVGGIAAASLMNAGSNVLKIINKDIANSREKKSLKKRIDGIFESKNLLDEYLIDLNDTVKKACDIYLSFLKKEKNIHFDIDYDDSLRVIADNSMKYMLDDEEYLLNSLCDLLSNCPEDKNALAFLTKYYFKDDDALHQISELASFLLFDSEFKQWEKEADKKKIEWLNEQQQKKRAQLEKVLSLPEENVLEISEKINLLATESERIGYNSEEEIKELNNRLLIAEKKEREKNLNKAKSLPEKTMEEIDLKIEQLTAEANKIGYNVDEDIHKLCLKKEKIERVEFEQEYKKALHLKEDTEEEIDLKIEKILSEAEKIGYSAKDHIDRLQNKKKEVIDLVEKKNKEYIIGEIFGSFMLNIYNLIKENELINDVHVIALSTIDRNLFDEADIEWVENTFDYYSDNIEIDDNELPIAFYYDNSNKNPKDSFVITTKKILLSNSGAIESIDIDRVKELIPVEKVLSSAIIINDEYKLSLALLGRKKIHHMIELLWAIINSANVMNKLSVDLPIEELNRFHDIYVTDEKIREIEAIDKRLSGLENSFDVESFIRNCESEYFEKLLKKNIYHEYLHPVLDMKKEEKKQYGLIKSMYDSIEEDEQILFFYDNTILRNMKESFVLTNRALHFRSERFSTGYLELEEIESIKVKLISLFPNFIINKNIKIPVGFLSDGAQEFVNLIRSMR